jgi:hypothetical protein
MSSNNKDESKILDVFLAPLVEAWEDDVTSMPHGTKVARELKLIRKFVRNVKKDKNR